jgi:hypothetical protein
LVTKDAAMGWTVKTWKAEAVAAAEREARRVERVTHRQQSAVLTELEELERLGLELRAGVLEQRDTVRKRAALRAAVLPQPAPPPGLAGEAQEVPVQAAVEVPAATKPAECKAKRGTATARKGRAKAAKAAKAAKPKAKAEPAKPEPKPAKPGPEAAKPRAKAKAPSARRPVPPKLRPPEAAPTPSRDAARSSLRESPLLELFRATEPRTPLRAK